MLSAININSIRTWWKYWWVDKCSILSKFNCNVFDVVLFIYLIKPKCDSWLSLELCTSICVPIVLFIPYFCLLVFGILVTLVEWFSFRFFPSYPSCLANVNKDYVIFFYPCNFAAKNDQTPKTNNGMNETKQLKTTQGKRS